MLSSLKIAHDSFSEIVFCTYYLTRDLLDCTKLSIFVINGSMDCDVPCLPFLNSNASLFENTISWFWLTNTFTHNF